MLELNGASSNCANSSSFVNYSLQRHIRLLILLYTAIRKVEVFPLLTYMHFKVYSVI